MTTKADWLRSEIEKLEKLRRKFVTQPALYKGSDANVWREGYNEALTSVITRYKEELEVLESK